MSHALVKYVEDDVLQVVLLKNIKYTNKTRKLYYAKYYHGYLYEAEVLKVGGSVERKQLLEKIRLKGTFEFNTSSNYNNGELIVARRPNKMKKRNTEHYVPCTNCHSFFTIHEDVQKLQLLNNGNQKINDAVAGEIERLLITDFDKRITIEKDKHSDLYKSLSTVEQYLAQRYMKIELRGKLGRSVPILLSLGEVNTVNLILKHRAGAQVDDNNPYVFACPGAQDKYLRACNALREFSLQCGAKYPENLRGTKLRKQIATVVQILYLNKTELEQLANFMGHDIKIHSDHYRLPSTAVQVGQLSKLLIMMEDGTMDQHRGKNLQQIDITGSLELQKPHSEDYQTNITILDENTQVSLNDNEQHMWTPRKNNQQARFTSSQCSPNRNRRRLAPVSPMGKIKRRTWSTPEKNAARKHFKTYIEDKYLPSGSYSSGIIRSDPDLRNRTVNQLKAWVNNQIILNSK
ncbi:hypothetical protein CBL_13815 [Carabus blaptoides fortunei]